MRLRRQRLGWLAGVCLAGLATPGLAFAQDAATAPSPYPALTRGQPDPSPAQSQNPAVSSQLSEIVVTAQKREQSAIDVPITITAYTGAFLNKLNIRDFHDLSLFTPGFYVQNQSPNN